MNALAPRGAVASRGARGWFWLQLAIGWVPVWALYATLMYTAHRGSLLVALLASGRAIAAAALLGLLVLRLTERVPWPTVVRVPFVLLHLGAALVYAHVWVAAVSLIESFARGAFFLVAPAGLASFVALGVWLYIAVAGVSYAVRATDRAARAEAAAVRAQLAALRSQIDPHFLFNALHTVVQLIPVSPDRAAEAAELLAGLLRSATQEDRDLVPLGEERAFVERYVALERLRFEDRLDIAFEMDPALGAAAVPAFALQTLVENAIRHGAAPRVEPTRITIGARREGETLVLEVADDGGGADLAELERSRGTGLRRLRERLDALFASRATLRVDSRAGAGFRATITMPFAPAAERA